MFSGIIKFKGKVISSKEEHLLGGILIESDLCSSAVSIGDSISVSGVCLSIVEFEDNRKVFRFNLSSETLKKTNLRFLDKGSFVNLESAISLSSLLNGHLVTGHIDTTTTVVSRERLDKNTLKLSFRIVESLRYAFVEKGSIAVDGISLTIGEVGKDIFSVYVIPITESITTLATIAVDSVVNIEIDPLARYVNASLKNLKNSK